MKDQALPELLIMRKIVIQDRSHRIDDLIHEPGQILVIAVDRLGRIADPHKSGTDHLHGQIKHILFGQCPVFDPFDLVKDGLGKKILVIMLEQLDILLPDMDRRIAARNSQCHKNKHLRKDLIGKMKMPFMLKTDNDPLESGQIDAVKITFHDLLPLIILDIFQKERSERAAEIVFLILQQIAAAPVVEHRNVPRIKIVLDRADELVERRRRHVQLVGQGSGR